MSFSKIRREISYLIVFVPLISLGCTGLVWFSIKGNLLLSTLSAGFFSLSFRAMSAQISEKNITYIFSVKTSSTYGKVLAYSHFLLLSGSFYLIFRSVSIGLDPLMLMTGFLLFVSSYLAGHLGAKGVIM